MALSRDKMRARLRGAAATVSKNSPSKSSIESEPSALLDSIPEPLRNEVKQLRANEVGFRTGPGFVAGELKALVPPVPISEALTWLDRYRSVFRKAHVELVDGRRLWFVPTGFIEATERKASYSAPPAPHPDREEEGDQAKDEQQDGDTWRQLTRNHPSNVDLDSYRSMMTVRFPLGRSERDRDMRFEDCRRRMADMVNAARARDLKAFAKHRFDLWVGQRLECGAYLDEMFITAAGLPASAFALFEAAISGAKVHVGRHPVADGAFPEIHVANGTVKSKWQLNQKLLAEWSRRFRDVHGLSSRVLDPYRQMARGADMPVDFDWRTRARTKKANHANTAGQRRRR